ncbi:MAG TPA: S8 family peptidase [Baekduia sp.]|jgi:subtilisin family serine protease
MLAVPRALVPLTTLILAALAVAPISGASAAGTRSPIAAADGLSARADHAAAAPGAPRAHATQVLSTDPRLDEQWELDGDDAMGAASAWRQTTGGNITVAIVDSGIDLTHPDLAPNLWTNPGEIPGNGIDDDGNGYVDDVHGVDLVDHDGDPQDANGHGTHVAGIVGARGGNGVGGAGLAWNVRLMAVRVLDANAAGTTTTVAQGIHYAVDNGARIVNLSLAGPTATPELEEAVQYAQAHGVLIVVAAGNDGADLATAPTYPAAYGETNVIGVAATTQSGELAAISDRGSGADIAAPGEQILSTALGGGYEWRTGTSMAAPQVTAALVLLAAKRPDLSADALRTTLLAHTRHTGLDVESGGLDVAAALRSVIAPSAWKNAPATKHAVSAKARKAAARKARARKARARAAARRAHGHAARR